MRHSIITLALLALPTVAAAVSVNGVTIPQSRVDETVKSVLQQQGAKDSPQLRQKIMDNLIENELIVQEATRAGIDKKPDFAAELAEIRRNILGRRYLSEWAASHPVSDKDIQESYNKAKAAMSGSEYEVRHIMFGNEAEAKAVLASLGKGGKFEALAKQKSTDKGSSDKGGLLGWVNPKQMPPAFADALKGTNKGQTIKAPVKVGENWHIIRVDNVRAAQVPPLAQMKDEITRQLQSQRFKVYLDQLKAKAKIQ